MTFGVVTFAINPMFYDPQSAALSNTRFSYFFPIL